MGSTILTVDDEKDIGELLAYNLEKEGWAVIKSYDGDQALQIIEQKIPDLVILDLMLPTINGLDLCRLLRKKPETERLPIIMLTAKSEDIDKIIGLEIGADDYITKPFNVRELVARVKALLRRSKAMHESDLAEQFVYNDLIIDFKTYQVFLNGQKVNLMPMEFKLLAFLAKHPDRVYTRDQLLDYVWGGESYVVPRTVDVHICNLRNAIEKDTESPQLIHTIRGIGYKFTAI